MKKRVVNNRILTVITTFLLTISLVSQGQTDSLQQKNDSISNVLLKELNDRLSEIERLRVADSIKKLELESQLKELKTADNLHKEELLKQLYAIEKERNDRLISKKSHIDSLRNIAKGYPVLGAADDTLFFIYNKIGASTPAERASTISKKIKKLYDDDFLKTDSIELVKTENLYDIVYHEMIIMSVSDDDAIWQDKEISVLAETFTSKIKQSIVQARKDNSLFKILLRIGLVLLVLILARAIIWLIAKGHNRLLHIIESNKDKWLKDYKYRSYTFLKAEQSKQIILFLLKLFRWFIYALLLYITLPIIFSIFPFSRNWADALFNLIWSPFKNVLLAIWSYLPNLFTILVIYFVMRYVIRFVKYIFREIESEKLTIPGFHADWAMPTYGIVRFLLYAFTLILIFPHLPGSDSAIFKGVSVFIGILFSLGSSSAIANAIAGLVITYMRPFKIGDRIKIGDVSGDVIEKTLLVTRVMTIKNEVITIPNSSILTGNTTNYSIEAKGKGLVIHTSVTIGYDVPWRDMQKALIDAALKTEMVLKDPKPFVLQTSLDDFYITYQINAFTNEASKQALIYSALHENILDVCNERGIEILSPHYRAERDGNKSTIPSDYHLKD